METEHRDFTRGEQALLHSSGPLANFCTGAAALLVSGFDVRRFAAVSFLLGGVSLLPLPGTDGGALLALWDVSGRWSRLLRRCTAVFLLAAPFLLPRESRHWVFFLPALSFLRGSVEEKEAV